MSTTLLVDSRTIGRHRGHRVSVTVGGNVDSWGLYNDERRGRSLNQMTVSTGEEAALPSGNEQLKNNEQRDGSEYRAPEKRQQLTGGEDTIQRDTHLSQTGFQV